MRRAVTFVFIAILFSSSGCLDKKVDVADRRKITRDADYYVRKYAEPQLSGLYPDDPHARIEVRKIRPEGRYWLAEIVVHSGQKSVPKKVLVDGGGRLVEERR